jgi:hypothetical protein
MKIKGRLQKFSFTSTGDEYTIIPKYIMELDSERLNMEGLIGRTIVLKYLNRISCINCGKDTKKSYGQGFCYPCFISIPQTEECVFHPELCRAHEGKARDMEYAKENCLVDQYVYLALSGGLKVGVTRYHQVPIRWVDQGAVKAIKVVKTSNRYLSGLVEVELKKVFADKTNWRKMLMGNDSDQDLVKKKQLALNVIEKKNLLFQQTDSNEYKIQYPVVSFPKKVVSTNLEKNFKIKGQITGIKGQYIIFASGEVLNIRKHSGFHVEMEVDL